MNFNGFSMPDLMPKIDTSFIDTAVLIVIFFNRGGGIS